MTYYDFPDTGPAQAYCSDCGFVHELETTAGCFLASSQKVNGLRFRCSESLPDDVYFKVVGPRDLVWVMKDGRILHKKMDD